MMRFTSTYFSKSSKNYAGLKGSCTKILTITFFLLPSTFSCRQAGTEEFSESPLSPLTQIIWFDSHKSSVASFCGKWCNGWSPNLVKSWWAHCIQISWESSRIVFGAHILYSFSGNTLTMNSSPVPHLANLLISLRRTLFWKV